MHVCESVLSRSTHVLFFASFCRDSSSGQDDIWDDFEEARTNIQRKNSQVAQTVKSMERQREHLKNILRSLRAKMKTPGPIGEYASGHAKLREEEP
jgi:hypothetical protein